VRLEAFGAGERRRHPSQRLRRAAPRVAPITLVRFWKSYTPSGEEKRAVREVGSTWFGPAQ
jgi:hypothetical protein